MSQIAADLPRRHRLSVADYYRMAEVGILSPDARVELIDGEIIDMAPIGRRHNATVSRLTKLFEVTVGNLAVVWPQNSIRLDNYSEPQPDIAVLRYRTDFYWSAQAGGADTLLIVEVAESSLRYDRDVKLPLYARHNVPEVWLVDINGRRLTRHRRPMQGRYTHVDEPDLGAPLEIEAINQVSVDLSELFPASAAT